MSGRTTLLIALAAAAAISLIAIGGASAAGSTQVRGIQRPAVATDPCFDVAAESYYWMGGGTAGAPALLGCWWVIASDFHATPSGVVTGTGTERFRGCVDLGGDGSCAGDPAGTLNLTFNYTVKLDFETFALQHGRCYHPIVDGTGDFEGATGAFRFKDDPVTGCSYYSGHVALEG